jgi:hypothetical protein
LGRDIRMDSPRNAWLRKSYCRFLDSRWSLGMTALGRHVRSDSLIDAETNFLWFSD